MSAPVLLSETRDGITRLTLNRPAAMNAIDLELAQALGEAAETAAGDRSVRVVLLQGAGRMFCAGGDLRHLNAAPPDELERIVGWLHRAVLAFAGMEPLLVVAAQGAAGAGLSLLAGADYALAAQGAIFASAYTAAGLTPDGGLSYRLPRLVGERRARTLMLTNRAVPADEALTLGLVDELAPPDRLEEAAEAAAARFARGPRAAFARVKRLVAGDLEALAGHLDAERAGITAALAGPEGSEGLAAFVEKRAPAF